MHFTTLSSSRNADCVWKEVVRFVRTCEAIVGSNKVHIAGQVGPFGPH